MTELHKPTLLGLLKEAQANFKEAKAAFDEFDNCEDMHSMESWESVVEWLKQKTRKA